MSELLPCQSEPFKQIIGTDVNITIYRCGNMSLPLLLLNLFRMEAVQTMMYQLKEFCTDLYQ